jgi:hypothetical protein
LDGSPQNTRNDPVLGRQSGRSRWLCARIEIERRIEDADVVGAGIVDDPEFGAAPERDVPGWKVLSSCETVLTRAGVLRPLLPTICAGNAGSASLVSVARRREIGPLGAEV